MNMFKPVKANSISEYIETLNSERAEIIIFLDAFIKKVSKDLKPHFAYNMLGYGSFRYKNHKKEILEWPIISLASQKNYVSLYVCALEDGDYIAEKYKDKLGKVSVGRSCIRFKKIEELNLLELEKIIKLAAKNPGITSN